MRQQKSPSKIVAANRKQAKSAKYELGISLLEVLLFLFIAGATLALGFAWLTAKAQSERSQEQAATLQQANRYIEAFSAANFRLPCPAADLNGVEDCLSNRAKGYLPYRTIHFDASQMQRGVGQLRYMVARSLTRKDDPLLATNPLNTFEPAKWDDKPAAPSLYDFKQVSTADYCRNLQLVPTAEAVVVSRNGADRPVAYAIASAGAADADGDGDLFDGRNADLNNAFMEAPENGRVSSLYDDAVLARTAIELGFNADCATLMMSLNTMALGIAVVDAAADAKVTSIGMMVAQTALAAAQSAATIGSIVLAGVSLATAITDAGIAAAALSAAIATCVVLVGCAAIPQLTAALVAASAAVVACTAALVAIGISLIPQVAYTVAVAAAAVAFGISTAQTLDLSKARNAAQAGLTASVSRKQITAQELANANAAATAATNAKNLAYAQLLQGARDTVANANAAGSPNGTTPITALDGDVSNVTAALENINAKQFALSVARGALETAESEVVALQSSLAIALSNVPRPNDPAFNTPGYNTNLTNIENLLGQTGTAAARAAQIQLQLNQKIIERNARLTDVTNAQNVLSAAELAYESPTAPGGAKGILIANSRREYCVGGTCGFFYNNQAAMLALVDNYKFWYDRFATKAAAISEAQAADNAAAEAIAKSQEALDNINALSEGTPLPGQAVITLWAGADAILQAADAKGGSK